MTKTPSKDRDQWGKAIEFVLSCMGYAVGLGNVWRFPYMCGQNGGAAFMIVYFIMMLFTGFPLFYMEVALGQYASKAPHILYAKMSPIFAGIGYSMLCITSFKAIYYNMILAYVFYYFGVSFTNVLPWGDCTHPWNDYACRSPTCFNSTHISILGSACYSRDFLNTTNMSLVASDETMQKILIDYPDSSQTILSHMVDLTANGESPANQYYYKKVLNQSEGIDTIGGLKWDLVLCYFSAWFLVFLCLVRGIKSSGKVVYFTATVPYFILIALLIRGLTLDGAMDGILFYVKPDPKYLLQANTWGKAASQVFFSAALGYGGLTTLSSYNHFNHNLFRDTLVVVLGDTMTSILAGFVVFPIVGFIAKQTGRSVAETAAAGPGLVFIAYADALSKMPLAPLWSAIFFFVLIILAIDTMIILVETVLTALLDQWPSLRTWYFKILVDAVVCSCYFLIGLIFCTPGGSYVLAIVDGYAGGWTLLVTCLTEICMVSYVYGYKRFIADCTLMLGIPPNKFYKLLGYPVSLFYRISWISISPFLTGAVIIFTWSGYKPSKLGDYDFPVWADGLGWCMAFFCISFIPCVALLRTVNTIIKREKFATLWQPTIDWGPDIRNDANTNDFQDIQLTEKN